MSRSRLASFVLTGIFTLFDLISYLTGVPEVWMYAALVASMIAIPIIWFCYVVFVVLIPDREERRLRKAHRPIDPERAKAIRQIEIDPRP